MTLSAKSTVIREKREKKIKRTRTVRIFFAAGERGVSLFRLFLIPSENKNARKIGKIRKNAYFRRKYSNIPKAANSKMSVSRDRFFSDISPPLIQKEIFFHCFPNWLKYTKKRRSPAFFSLSNEIGMYRGFFFRKRNAVFLPQCNAPN